MLLIKLFETNWLERQKWLLLKSMSVCGSQNLQSKAPSTCSSGKLISKVDWWFRKKWLFITITFKAWFRGISSVIKKSVAKQVMAVECCYVQSCASHLVHTVHCRSWKQTENARSRRVSFHILVRLLYFTNLFFNCFL